MDTESSWWIKRISFPVPSKTTWMMSVRGQWFPLVCLRSLTQNICRVFHASCPPLPSTRFSHRFDGVQVISIGHDLCLECLVLLQFGLQIAWILPAIILGNAILLINPGSHLWGGKNRNRQNLQCFFSSKLPGSPLIRIKHGTTEWRHKWVVLLRFCFPKRLLSFIMSLPYITVYQHYYLERGLSPWDSPHTVRKCVGTCVHIYVCIGEKAQLSPISNPLSVSHKKITNLSLPMNFKMVPHSLLMHLFLLHFAGVQWTVDLSCGDWREAVTWKLKNTPPFLSSSFPISSYSRLTSFIFLTVNSFRD